MVKKYIHTLIISLILSGIASVSYGQSGTGGVSSGLISVPAGLSSEVEVARLLNTEGEDVITSEAGEPFLSSGVTTLQGFETHNPHVAFLLTEDGIFIQSEDAEPLLIWNVEIEQVTPGGDIAGGDFALARITGSTFSTVQHLQDIFHSAGWVSGGGITDDGDGTITVATGTGLIRATDSATAEILFMDWAAESGANVNLADNDVSWGYVEYNSGSPRVIATTTERTDFNTNVLLFVIQRAGTTLHINATDKHTVGDHANSMIRRLKATLPYGHVSGGIIGEAGTRNITITAGSFWRGLTEFTTAALDTSAAGRFSYWYNDGSWVEVTSQAQINNTQYNNFGVGLATVSNNKYGVHHGYLEADDDNVAIVYGIGDYTLVEAQNALSPSALPEHLTIEGIRSFKIIIKKSDSVFAQKENLYRSESQGSLASDHGNTAGLSDDDHSIYALLLGRSGGQEIIGGTATNDNLILRASSDAAPGNIIAELLSNSSFLIGNRTPVGTWTGDGVSASSTTITDVGGAAHGLSLAAGDLVHITAGGTAGDLDSYRIVSDDGTNVVLDRTLSGSNTDLTVTFYKDVLLFAATDGTNGQRIMNYSHQNKPLQLGGDTLLSPSYVANTGQSPDIQIGRRLILPQVDEPATPTLTFGIGDTGFYEKVAGTVIFTANGAAKLKFSQDGLAGAVSGSGFFLNEPASSTNPSIGPRVADFGTGIGWAGTGKLSLIANSIEISRLTENDITTWTSHLLKRFLAIITLDTGDTETDVGLTPNAVIMSAAIRVSTQITGLDSADHSIQLGINGTSNKYISKAQGASQTTIDVNIKDKYTFDPTTDTESSALVLTIIGGSDSIPTAGAVEVEIIYLDSANLPDV